MPTSKSSTQHSRQDSWLSPRVLLQPSVERDDAEIEDLDLASMGEDPLIYFLTPTPSSYAADDGMDFDMDFDAGIEDAKHPPPIVRSVSPSSLGGLSRPPPRPPTPPRSPSTPDLDYSLSATPDEHEHYDYMEDSWPPSPSPPRQQHSKRGSSLSLPRRLKDKFKGHHLRHDDFGGSSSGPDSLAPLRHFPSSRGRPPSRGPGLKPIGAAPSSFTSGVINRPRGTPGRLSPHAWREPSPDVWAIEEEPEEAIPHDDMGESCGSLAEEMHSGRLGNSSMMQGSGKARALDIPAAKPKKRVRFVLPAAEDCRGTY